LKRVAKPSDMIKIEQEGIRANVAQRRPQQSGIAGVSLNQ
jgi:hypothetical protein